jgi:uncharacterized membrane protein
MVVANVFAKNAKALAPQAPGLLVWASLTAVALSWLLTHTYAHLYYRDKDTGADGDEGPPGRGSNSPMVRLPASSTSPTSPSL